MKYLGDYAEDYADVNVKFHTHSLAGVPTTLAGSPVVKCYKSNATGTETATGVTLSVDFDGVTGLNNVNVDLSADAFYAIGNDYSLIITTGTVDSVSVVGAVIATFSIENRFGNTQDVIETNKLDHLVAVADADDPVNNSIIAKLAAKGATADWSTFANTSDSLEAAADQGADINTGVNTLETQVGTAGDGLTAIADIIGDSIIETNNSITHQQAMSIILAAATGDNAVTATTVRDPSGTTTRIQLSISGNKRSSITLTPSS